MFRHWALVYLITLLGGLPADAYDLGQELCGGLYGSINIKFSKDIKNKRDIDSKIKNISWADEIYKEKSDSDTLWLSQSGNTSLRKELWKAFDDSQKGSIYLGVTDIWVPLGSEEQVAITLIKEKIIKEAGRAVGGCGGTDLVALRLTKKQVDVEDARLLSKYLEVKLEGFIKGSDYSGSVESVKFVRSPFPPFFPYVEFNVVSPSNLSRKTKNSHVWDRFNIVFQVVNFRDGGYDVLVYANLLQIAPMSVLNKRSPSKEYFKVMGGDRALEEFYTAGIIVDYISGGGENCMVDSLMLGEGDRRKTSCNIDREELAN